MSYEFLSWCLSTPWALMPDRMQAYAGLLARRYAGMPMRAMEDDGPSTPPPTWSAVRGDKQRGGGGAIAVIPIMGTIVQYASQLDMCEGGTTTSQIVGALREAMADDSVSQVLLRIHSPGGSVYGVQEAADEIIAARKTKPIVAIADSLSASAAYWLACAAGEVYVTPGGEVGSIGVWMAHQDISKALAEAGVDVTLISAGKYKVEGHPYGPLDPEARDFMQSRTNDYYQAFTKAVAKGRGVPIDAVREGMGQGRVLGASAALDQKMVDGISTFDDLVRNMIRANKSAPAGRSAAAAHRDLQILG
jgi:signal peptide peptidase SppA